MKKLLTMVIAATLMGSMLAGCGSRNNQSSVAKIENTAAEGSNEESAELVGGLNGKTVGYCIVDTSESFLANLSNDVKEKFKADGVKVDIANAAGDSTTQISQIENFATAGTDLIILMSVDPMGVTDAIKRAQSGGTKVMVAGSDTGAYDAIMFVDQYADGQMIAELGADWVENTFPDAEPGSIEIAILEDRSTPEANQRCDGINTITDLTDKIKIVKTVGSVKNNDTAQAAMGNIMQTNPNIKLVLCYNSSSAIGANEYAMREGSAIKDKSQFAIFCSDFDPAAIASIADSADDRAVLRGLVKFGGDDLAQDTYELAKKMISGGDFDVQNPDPLTKITTENVANYQ